MPSRDHDRYASRQRVIEAAACAQEEAMQRLRQAGFSEAELFIALEYFKSLLKRLLTEADAVYSVYETQRLSQPGRTAANQQWLDTQFARLLYVYQESTEELMTAAMRHATNGFLRSAYQDQDMFGELRSPPRQVTWAGRLWQAAKVIIWLMGLLAGFLLLLACNDVFFGGFVQASYIVVGAGLVLAPCGVAESRLVRVGVAAATEPRLNGSWSSDRCADLADTLQGVPCIYPTYSNR
jgi:hypothetical protein